MKIMGIDISSKSTGWSIIEDDKLLEYGKVNPTGKMSTAQKLFLFHVELRKLIERHNPDETAIEDVPLVKSVSVAKLLARFNGVAMIEAYRHLQCDPELFEPSKWKKLIEISGSSKKCEVQLEVCIKYNLLTSDKIELYRDRIEAAKLVAKDSSEDVKEIRKDLKKQLRKAKKEKQFDTETAIKLQLEELKTSVKKNIKKQKKEASKLFDAISMDIYTETSINEDIADSVGVAIAYQKSMS